MSSSSPNTENGHVSSSASAATTPGAGWSNGDIEPLTLYPSTREGLTTKYSSQRRWINVKSSWSRIGKGTTEHSFRHSDSFSGDVIVESDEDEAKTIRALIAQLCERFYEHGWATGTGGGVSIRIGGPSENRPWRVFVAPSGIQKEDMVGDDIFELDMDKKVVVAPMTPNLRQSACTPLWFVVYRNRPTAKCVIHTHSIHAQMATLLDPTETSKTFKMTHLEMIKGVGNHAYDDVLEIPIIDNRPSEDLLAAQLEDVIQQYPKCNAVLVRRHGLYVWGDSWEQAKTQCESFDYLFESAIQMNAMGMNPANIPTSGTYREEENEKEQPVTKRARISNHDFNAASDTNNDDDLHSNKVPILPRDGKILLLDIEGCTTSISFVKDVLFPYVLEHLDDYVADLDEAALEVTWDLLHKDICDLPNGHAVKETYNQDSTVPTRDHGKIMREIIAKYVRLMVKHDVKATGLKDLQGQMWKFGYDSGKIKGHVYPDFMFLLQWCKANNISVNIYSSGSIQAQKLLFGHTSQGDLLPYLNQHFDTTSGNKKEKKSYQIIANKLGVKPSDVVFVSDSETELVAAQEAGIGHAIMSIRPGNAPLTTHVGKSFPAVYSLLQLCGV